MAKREEEESADLDGTSTEPSAAVVPMDHDAVDENGEDDGEDAEKEAAELAAMKARVAEMEREAQMLRDMTAKAESDAEASGSGAMGDDEKEAVDQRSVYVGNVSSERRAGATGSGC